MNFTDLNDELIKKIMTFTDIKTIGNVAQCNKHCHDLFKDYINKIRTHRKQIITKYHFSKGILYIEFHGLATATINRILKKNIIPEIKVYLKENNCTHFDCIGVLRAKDNVFVLPVLYYAMHHYNYESTRDYLGDILWIFDTNLNAQLDNTRYDVMPLKYAGKNMIRDLIRDIEKEFSRNIKQIHHIARVISRKSDRLKTEMRNGDWRKLQESKNDLREFVANFYNSLPIK